jgi:hypothetical protein
VYMSVRLAAAVVGPEDTPQSWGWVLASRARDGAARAGPEILSRRRLSPVENETVWLRRKNEPK